ncbi:MAG: Na/Pi cotransporter family protein [Alphaproteobacteria bacterium]|nr:Na/Pi cotransporter family protein [Alphaproteobacteria bacterium]
MLLWGTRMVKLGFTRAYGTSLHRALLYSTRNRFYACASGIGVTSLLQSSTATALLLISFVKKSTIPLTAALAVIIGADIATTLVAQILTLDLSWLSPALLILGVSGYLIHEHGGRKRHIFRIVIGLGLMLLALALIKQASAPLTHSDTLPLILAPLEFDPITAILFSAILTWVMHSSLAAVLLFASLASNNIIDLELGTLLVLGANLGGGFIPFIATYKDGVIARRITFGNIIMRTAILALTFFFMDTALGVVEIINLDTARNLINLHMGFNLALAFLFLPNVQWITRLCERLLPEKTSLPPKAYTPLYLDNKALSTPVVALASAARETLRMAEMVQDMLEKTIEAFKQNDTTLAKAISEEDNTIDRLYYEIKLYMTKLTQEALDPKESDRYLQIITFATNLEHIGDIIDNSLMELAKKKIKKKERFSDKGWAEIKDFHRSVVENMRMAQTIFLSEDPSLARSLIEQKRIVSDAAKSSSALHFERLRSGLPETIATSSLHLDIIRDYRRINSYITSVAYAILENAEKYKKQRKKR